jgi:hypothetical protein
MIKRLLVLPLSLILYLQVIPLAAQSVPAEQTQSTQEPPASPADKNDNASSAAMPEGSAEEKAPSAKSNASPFDYRSSEKISEDVPVSFPVDI